MLTYRKKYVKILYIKRHYAVTSGLNILFREEPVMLRYLRSKKGFTMIELIVVIAIIGILTAIIVPSMIGAGRPQEADTRAESFYYALQNVFIDYKANNPENTPGYYTLADGTKLDDETQYFMVYAEADSQGTLTSGADEELPGDFTDIKVAKTATPTTQYSLAYQTGISDPMLLNQLNAKTSGEEYGYYCALVDSECRVLITYWCREPFDDVFGDYENEYGSTSNIMFTDFNYVGDYCVGSFPNSLSVKNNILFDA